MTALTTKKRLLYTSLASLTLGAFATPAVLADELANSDEMLTSYVKTSSLNKELIITESAVMMSTLQKDSYEPLAHNQRVEPSHRPFNAEDFIANSNALPINTSYTWKTAPNLSTFSEKATRKIVREGGGEYSFYQDIEITENREEIVVVTYPDGSTDEVTVTITLRSVYTADGFKPSPIGIPGTGTTTTPVVNHKPFADSYTINVTNSTVKIGTVIDPASLISNKTELPENTEFSWVNPPRTELPGTVAYNQIRISFADGSHKVVRVKVSVSATQAQLYIPEGLAQTFAINSSVSPEELIKNKGNLPENTRFTWALKPDLTRPGGKLARVNIIYPDGSIDEVVIRFVVR